MINTNTEELILAQKAAYELVNILRHAHKDSGPVDSIILLPLIKRAAELKADIEILFDALKAESEGKA